VFILDLCGVVRFRNREIGTEDVPQEGPHQRGSLRAEANRLIREKARLPTASAVGSAIMSRPLLREEQRALDSILAGKSSGWNRVMLCLVLQTPPSEIWPEHPHLESDCAQYRMLEEVLKL
jgi:hypothetical protein